MRETAHRPQLSTTSTPLPVSPEAGRPGRGLRSVPTALGIGLGGVLGVGVAGTTALLVPGHRDHGPESIPLALISLVATLTYLGLFVSLHRLPTGYDPVRHAVSDYAVGRYAPVFRVGLYVSSAAVLALGLALAFGIGSPPIASRDLVYLGLIPVARVGMALLPTDLEGARRSRTGLLHYACAIAAFTFTYLLISETTPVLTDVTHQGWLEDPLHGAAAMVGPLLFLVVITLAGPLRRVFGLTERLFLVTTNVWFALVALVLVTRP